MSLYTNKDVLIKAMLQSVKDTETFSLQDIAWVDLILNRSDGQVGPEQLKPLIAKCEEFLDKKEEYLKKEKETGRSATMRIELAKTDLYQCLFAVKSLYYKQKKIAICVASRKRHPLHSIPNLGNFIAPQAYRCEVLTAYGMGYSESRNYLVEEALKINATHALFVDDDILLPLNGLDALIQANEMMVGALYYKRNITNESVVTTIGDDPTYYFHNKIVDAKEGSLVPVPANAMGLGATLIDLSIFKSMEKPYFQFVWENNPDGSRGRLLVGEDSRHVQYMLMNGYTPKILPGVVAVHVDLKSGEHYGPEYLVDPVKRKLRPEFEAYYTKFVCDTKELVSKDISNEFGGA